MPPRVPKSPRSSRSGCGSVLLGALAVPVILLLALVGISLTPQGRTTLGRAGTALQVLRGQTPSILVDPEVEKATAEAEAEASRRAGELQARLDAARSAQAEAEAARDEALAARTADAAAPDRDPNGYPRLPSEVPAEPTWNPTRLFNGLTVETDIVRHAGDISQRIRNLPESYRARWQLEVTLPRPALSLDELQAATPELGRLLPGLPRLLERAELSPVWPEMQRRKLHGLGSALSNLAQAPYRHNFFDINTALQFSGSDGRRAFLLQGDMDIVTDGSDGDRLPSIPEEILASPTYQATTSYGWAKRGGPENPLIERYRRGNREAQAQIDEARRELRGNPSNARERELNNLIASQVNRRETNERIIRDLQSRSYLIAEHDPFVVMPTWVLQWRGENAASMPRVGDYALVIHGDQVLPAIVGDAGPNQKVGEASLRIARQINPETTQYRGAVDDLSVTYLVFPGSADPAGPPDYDRWRSRCEELLQQIGGLGEGVQLHRWSNTLPAPPDAAEADAAEAQEQPAAGDTAPADGDPHTGGETQAMEPAAAAGSAAPARG